MSKNQFDPDRVLGSVREVGGRGLHAGNVVDLAVGVVIGAAFNGLVQAVVKDLITPLVGLMGVGNLSDFQVVAARGNIFRFGDVLNLFISFLITAAVVFFFVVKPMNILHDRYESLHPKHEETPKTRECPFCLNTVPRAATRCAYCTSQLTPADDDTPSGH